MSNEVRIGVYICHCGLNIAGVIDVKKVAEYAGKLPNVVVARDYVFMCSAPGQEMIKEDIKKHNLNRVVVAACSPSMHEPTFRGAVEDAGLNPYLMEMANIREHSSWVHPDKPEAATEKAMDIVKMAVAKARNLRPLEKIRSDVTHSVMVLGGGVSGLTAALDLAERGFEVYLVEKKPTLGGHTARIGFISDGDVKASSLIKSLVDKAVNNPLIKIYTNTEVSSVDGSIGKFTVKVVQKPRYVDSKCILCGKCVEVCPVEVDNEYEYGLGRRKAIYIPFEDAYPNVYVIDGDACTFCGKCVEVCGPKAINLDEKEREIKIEVGGVVLAIGYDPYEPSEGEYGYRLSPNVVTLFQLERLLSEDGPTKGELTINGKKPNRIVFISCVGSLGTSPNAHSYCSRMCCVSALKNILNLKKKYGDIEVYYIYKDIRTYGRLNEALYWKTLESLVRFVKFDDPPKVIVEDKVLAVEVYDPTIQENILIPADLVVLVNGMSPSKDVDTVRNIFKVGCGLDGFIREAHLKLRPVESLTDGIFLAGTVSGPKNIVESMVSGSAAAAKAAGLMSKDVIEVEPIVAVVDEDRCSGCGICVSLCPFEAIRLEEREGGKRVSVINSTLCKGCGTCGAACPSGAIQQNHFRDSQLFPQLIALFGGE